MATFTHLENEITQSKNQLLILNKRVGQIKFLLREQPFVFSHFSNNKFTQKFQFGIYLP